MRNPGFSHFVAFEPGQKVNNDHLPFTNIEPRTGIGSRFIAADTDTPFSIACEAVEKLFQTLGIKGKDCGGLVLASGIGSEDRKEVTHVAQNVAHNFGVRGRAEGVNYACSGFPAAVQKALAICTETDRHVLVVTAEIMSRLIDWSDENTAILFGDCATATSLIENGNEVLHVDVKRIADPHNLLFMEKKDDARKFDGRPNNHEVLQMNGKKLYMEAPEQMLRIARESLANIKDATPHDVAAIIPHQANGRFMEKIGKRLQRDAEQGWGNIWVVDEIRERGNVGASSIPAAVSNIQESLVPGKIILAPTIGAGSDIHKGELTEGIVAWRVKE